MPPINTLSYGYEKPVNPTTGDVFWLALERNIQRMNDHSHNGTDGPRIAATTEAVSAASWGSDLGNGKWRQTITLPTGFTFDNARIEVRRSTGEMVYPTIEKIDSTSFYLYTNDDSLAYVISYL